MATLMEGLLGYNRGLVALDAERQQVQENSLKLQQQMQGVQQQKMENEAIKQFDPSNLDSLQKVAGTLAQAGDSSGAMNVMKTYSDLKSSQQLAQTRNAAVKTEQFKGAGGILSTMTQSPQAYSKGLMSLSALGINPASMGLTGSYETDAPALPGMARSTISAYQQVEIQQRAAMEDRRVQQEADKLEQQAKQNTVSQQRLDLAEARSARQDNIVEERSKMDTLKQNKADSQLKAKQLQLSRPLKQQIVDVLGEISLDDRVKDAPTAMKNVLATRLASRTSSALASKVDPNYPEAGFEPESYVDEAKRQLDLMIEKGEWAPFKSKIFGKNEGGLVQQTARKQQEAAGKINQAPEAQAKVVDPKSLPIGGLFPLSNGKKMKIIGKDAKGNPLFESDANGNPVFY